MVVGERAPSTLAAPFVVVEDARAALSKAAARFYPRQPGTIVAVTGTSGKTSVAAFARQIWASAGREFGVARHARRRFAPDRRLRLADHARSDRAAPDARHARPRRRHASRARSLVAWPRPETARRRAGFAAGAFTNLSRDHLDYHATTEAYLDAKLRLFRELLPPGAAAVIDGDSEVAPRVIEAARAHGLSPLIVGRRGGALRLVRRRSATASVRASSSNTAARRAR